MLDAENGKSETQAAIGTCHKFRINVVVKDWRVLQGRLEFSFLGSSIPVLGSDQLHLIEKLTIISTLNVTRRTAMTILGTAPMIAIAKASFSHAASSLQDFGSQLQTLP